MKKQLRVPPGSTLSCTVILDIFVCAVFVEGDIFEFQEVLFGCHTNDRHC